MQEMNVPAAGAFVFGGHATLALATVRLDLGEVARAQRLAAPILDAAARGGWVETEAQAALVLARCRLARGDADGAEGLHERALTLAAEVGLPGVQRTAANAAPYSRGGRRGARRRRPSAIDNRSWNSAGSQRHAPLRQF